MRNSVLWIGLSCVLLVTALFSIGRMTASSDTLGAWVKEASNPVLRPGASGAWDDGGVESPDVLHDGTQFHMWYTGLRAGSDASKIGHATSANGIIWQKDINNPVLQLSTDGWDSAAVSAPAVIYRPEESDPNKRWRMWYVGRNSLFLFGIGYAYSSNGVNWTKYGNRPVLEASGGSWDDEAVLAPTVIFRNGLYHMWYSAKGEQLKIGYATSPDGVTWTQHASNPVLSTGAINQWDNGEIAAPSVRVGSNFEMWYQGVNLFLERTYIGYATASNETGWSKAPVNPVMGGGPEAWDAYSVFYPTVLEHDGTLMLWYHGVNVLNGTRQIGLARFRSNEVPTAVPTFPVEPPTRTPTPSPTPVPPTATTTPTPSPTITPGGPTLTPTPTNTPTNTPTPTITPGGPTLTPTPTITPGGPTLTPTPTATGGPACPGGVPACAFMPIIARP